MAASAFPNVHLETIPCVEYVITLMLFAFKNAYNGFWKSVKKEVIAIQHDEIAVELCDVINAFYGAETNEAAIDVLASAYQKFPNSPTANCCQ